MIDPEMAISSRPSAAALAPANADKPTAAREANHRIANNLSLVGALVRLHHREAVKQGGPVATGVTAVLQEIEVRIEAVGRLHRLLSALDDGATVPLDEYLRGIGEAAASSVAATSAFELSLSLSRAQLHPDAALAVGMIVTEAIMNAAKYAHPAGVPGLIEVLCEQDPVGTISIAVADDGVGFADGFDPAADGGLGMRLIHSMAEQLGARLTFQSGPLGLRVELVVPAAC
jgi:two-component sensor histidine kinase